MLPIFQAGDLADSRVSILHAAVLPTTDGTTRGRDKAAVAIRASSSLGVMTTAEDDPDREHESQAGAPAPAAETSTPLRKAAAGMAEAQAWKGQQISKGWRKLVNALRRREEGGSFVS